MHRRSQVLRGGVPRDHEVLRCAAHLRRGVGRVRQVLLHSRRPLPVHSHGTRYIQRISLYVIFLRSCSSRTSATSIASRTCLPPARSGTLPGTVDTPQRLTQMCSDLMWSDPVEEKTFEDWQVYDLNRYRKIDFDSNPGRNLCVLLVHTNTPYTLAQCRPTPRDYATNRTSTNTRALTVAQVVHVWVQVCEGIL